MPDEVKDDVQEGEEEVQELPTPEISAGSTEAGSAQPGFDADAFEEKFFSRLDEVLDDKVDRRVKSMKDKRFNTLAKADEILAAVELAGGDPEKIRGRLEGDALLNRIDALEEKLSSGEAGGTVSAADIQSQMQNHLNKIEADTGVTFSVEELKELASNSQSSGNTDKWLGELTVQAIKKAKSGNVTPAAVVGTSGVPAASSNEEETLTKEMDDLYAGVKGPYALPENQVRLKEIQVRLQEIAPMEILG